MRGLQEWTAVPGLPALDGARFWMGRAFAYDAFHHVLLVPSEWGDPGRFSCSYTSDRGAAACVWPPVEVVTPTVYLESLSRVLARHALLTIEEFQWRFWVPDWAALLDRPV